MAHRRDTEAVEVLSREQRQSRAVDVVGFEGGRVLPKAGAHQPRRHLRSRPAVHAARTACRGGRRPSRTAAASRRAARPPRAILRRCTRHEGARWRGADDGRDASFVPRVLLRLRWRGAVGGAVAAAVATTASTATIASVAIAIAAAAVVVVVEVVVVVVVRVGGAVAALSSRLRGASWVGVWT